MLDFLTVLLSFKKKQEVVVILKFVNLALTKRITIFQCQFTALKKSGYCHFWLLGGF